MESQDIYILLTILIIISMLVSFAVKIPMRYKQPDVVFDIIDYWDDDGILKSKIEPKQIIAKRDGTFGGFLQQLINNTVNYPFVNSEWGDDKQ